MADLRTSQDLQCVHLPLILAAVIACVPVTATNRSTNGALMCLQATNGTNATVAVSGYSPTDATAPAPAATLAPGPSFALTPAQSPAPPTPITTGTSSPTAAATHRGRSLLSAVALATGANSWQHCLSAVQHYDTEAVPLLSITKLSKILQSLRIGIMPMTGRMREDTAHADNKTSSKTTDVVEHTSDISLLYSGPRAKLSAMISWRQRCIQHGVLLVKHMHSLLIQTPSFSEVVSSRLHVPWREKVLRLKGPPWWPFFPWQQAHRQERAGRLLAEAPGVDLVVTVTVPAGQNSSATTSSIEGPSFAPNLQQSLSSQGVIQCIHVRHCTCYNSVYKAVAKLHAATLKEVTCMLRSCYMEYFH